MSNKSVEANFILFENIVTSKIFEGADKKILIPF